MNLSLHFEIHDRVEEFSSSERKSSEFSFVYFNDFLFLLIFWRGNCKCKVIKIIINYGAALN